MVVVLPSNRLCTKVTGFLFSVRPLCPLCLCGELLAANQLPQRHRGHRGCTEKSIDRRLFVQVRLTCSSAGLRTEFHSGLNYPVANCVMDQLDN
jgi:hypothetical protein